MKQTRLIMGMPITVWVTSRRGDAEHAIDEAYDFFTKVDAMYSTYKSTSEISLLNNGKLTLEDVAQEVRYVLGQCEELRKQTLGYFDICFKPGYIDPSGYVKGWAVKRACELLDKNGFTDYCVDAGGDIMFRGDSEEGEAGWLTGIAAPRDDTKVVKVLRLKDMAIATSGNYIRGPHIIDPHTGQHAVYLEGVSVIGPDICISDVLATTIFAMGQSYSTLLTQILPVGYDAYVIDKLNSATFTAGFQRFVVP